jgi:hypothetical protein
MAKDTIEDAGVELSAATADAGSAVAEEVTEEHSQATIEAAVARTMEDLAAEARREARG